MFARRQFRQRAVITALCALAIALTGLLTVAKAFDANLQAAVYDTFITNNPGRLSNQITIVAIDDATIKQYGRWPLPRQAYADLLKALKPLRPSVIGFDVSFFDRSDRPADDQALAEAIKDAGNVVLAMQGKGSAVPGGGTTQFSDAELPLQLFREVALSVASVNILPDDDGRVRTAQLMIDTPSGRQYALPLVAAARHVRADLGRAQFEGDRLVVPAPITSRVIPLDPGGGTAVYYAAPPATNVAQVSSPCSVPGEFCVVSLKGVVEGTVPASLLQNRLILIGAHSISSVPDDYPVPNSAARKMYGVEIWANTAASILTNRYPVKDQGTLLTLIQAALVIVGGVVLVARFRLFGFLGALGLLVLYSIAQYLWFSVQVSGSVGSGPVPVASLGYLFPAVFWWVIALGYILVEEQLALARTQTTFGRFVTPSVARTIMEREETGRLALGGEEKRVTVLFGDIRGFTTMSEGMGPGTLLNTLNQYFDGMVDIVNRYEGTVNKYNGDNIMVIFGAPLDVKDQARKAVECALELQRFIVAERAKGGPEVSFGFGINTGPVVAGFLGAKGRMEYTVIGDTANVASRLTSSDIARRDQVAVSGATLAELGDDVKAVDLGAISVKGRAEPVACYQIDRLGTVASPNPAPAPERPIGQAAVAGYH
ncbi:MAG TPA: adenylate/guanylate cyclase domain-containing protein [Candidatus Limnocylindria bacterium]|nr:adenylate/guanylate cyclase domain-containing protein [Candidatus Limnocylindria bacterium]